MCACTCVHAWFNWDSTASLECTTDSSSQLAGINSEIMFREKTILMNICNKLEMTLNFDPLFIHSSAVWMTKGLFYQ